MASLVLAHRGVTENAPDNSIPAVRALQDLSVDGLEFDVRVSADDIPIATHDPTVAGRTFESLTLSDLRQLQGAAVDDPHRIPTLDEVLAVLPTGLTVNLELKSERLGSRLVAAIEQMDTAYDLVVTSFDRRPLLELKTTLPRVTTGLINSVPIADPVASIRDCQASALSSHWRLVDRDLVEELARCGIALFVWTVNDDTEIRRMADLGVAAIITDVPRTALALLGRG